MPIHHSGSDMRILRLFTLLALLLTLPSYGLAGLTQRSCQEEMRASAHVVLDGDCCPGKADHGTPCKQLGDGPLGKKGPCSACKVGYNCKSPSSFESTPSTVLLTSPASDSISVEPSPLAPSDSPDGLLRPPRLI